MKEISLVSRILILIGFVLITQPAWAEVSDWGKITEVCEGDWNYTKVCSSVTFPDGLTCAKLDMDHVDHDRILSLILTAITNDFDARFHLKGRWIQRIEIRK